MTLIISLIGRSAIFLMADRRLTKGMKPVADDAIKVMRLDTTDGAALLGYAGLGRTVNGTEPSAWMSRTLRGVNLPLEQSLGVLAENARKELPRHLGAMSHVVLAPAMIGGSTRQYVISLAPPGNSGVREFRHHREVVLNTDRSPRVVVTGSGTQHLPQPRLWARPLLRLLSRYEGGQITARPVADALAALNEQVHRRNKTVGSASIVAWIDGAKGGGQHCYQGSEQVSDVAPIPVISNGTDVAQLGAAILRYLQPQMEVAAKGGDLPEITAEINEVLAKLPWAPDPSLK